MNRTLGRQVGLSESLIGAKLELTPRSSFEDATRSAEELRQSWNLGDVPAETLDAAIARGGTGWLAGGWLVAVAALVLLAGYPLLELFTAAFGEGRLAAPPGGGNCSRYQTSNASRTGAPLSSIGIREPSSAMRMVWLANPTTPLSRSTFVTGLSTASPVNSLKMRKTSSRCLPITEAELRKWERAT